MARFDRQIETALRLIKKNGQLVKWKVVRDATPQPDELPWKPQPGADVEKDVYVCFLPIDKDTARTVMRRNGTEVALNSEMGLMGAVDFDPDARDVVIRNGVEYRIYDFDILRPNGQNILYTVFFYA